MVWLLWENFGINFRGWIGLKIHKQFCQILAELSSSTILEKSLIWKQMFVFGLMLEEAIEIKFYMLICYLNQAQYDCYFTIYFRN